MSIICSLEHWYLSRASVEKVSFASLHISTNTSNFSSVPEVTKLSTALRNAFFRFLKKKKKKSTAISSETKRRMAKRPQNFSDRLMMLFQNFNILESKSGICIPCQAITMDEVSKNTAKIMIFVPKSLIFSSKS